METILEKHRVARERAKVTAAMLVLVGEERQKQERLFAEGKIPFRCADYEISHWRKLPVMMEEAGEVAKELNEFENGNRTQTELRNNLRVELIQLAAVAVAWAEALEG